MTNYGTLDIEQVLYIHDMIVYAAGGKHGIRDFNLLHSGLERCKATFAGQDLYPSLLQKAAALLHSLVMNHAFLDANKRTAFAVTSRFLNSNGVFIKSSQEEIVRFCIAVDNEGLTLKQIVTWLEVHTLTRAPGSS